MFELSTPLLELILRPVIILCFLMVMMRLTGSRQEGELSPFDLVTVLLIGGALERSIVGEDTSVLAGMISVAVILGFNMIVNRIKYNKPKIRELIEGPPVVLVERGKVIEKNARKENLSQEDILALARNEGHEDLRHIKFLILENNGSISLIEDK